MDAPASFATTGAPHRGPWALALTVVLASLCTPLATLAQAGHDQHAGHGAAGHSGGYAGLGDREIKALSNDELEGFLRGEGLGLALAAELNGIPGPLHVLELAEPLELDAEQLEGVEAIFSAMREATSRLGSDLVELERTLDRRFSHRHIDPDVIRDLTSRIASLQGEIRAIHLIAHLEVDAILTEEQRAAYQKLRGYDDPER
jgi:Spy/CpxP family protein refolding chaperone